MAEMLLNWVSDRLAGTEIIDLYFIVSDLIDISLSEDELNETAHYDAYSSHATENRNINCSENIPIGKLVL